MRDIENSTPENPYLDDCHYAQGIFLHDGVYYVVAGERLSWAYEVYVKQHPFLGLEPNFVSESWEQGT